MPNPQEPHAAADVGPIVEHLKREHEGGYQRRLTGGHDGPFCVLCRDWNAKPVPWPCAVYQLAAHVEALQAEKEEWKALAESSGMGLVAKLERELDSRGDAPGNPAVFPPTSLGAALREAEGREEEHG